jgi:hypothetical protein
MLQFAVGPVFLILSCVNYFQPSPMCFVPGNWGFLSSMWLMYLVMALAHSTPWFTLLSKASTQRVESIEL